MTELNNEIRELPIEEMTADELEMVSGGKGRSQRIHMDYHNMNNFNDKTAVRIC